MKNLKYTMVTVCSLTAAFAVTGCSGNSGSATNGVGRAMDGYYSDYSGYGYTNGTGYGNNDDYYTNGTGKEIGSNAYNGYAADGSGTGYGTYYNGTGTMNMPFGTHGSATDSVNNMSGSGIANGGAAAATN